jgi:hypothetical protein
VTELSVSTELADAQLPAMMSLLQPLALNIRARFERDVDRGERIVNRISSAVLHLDAARFGAKLYELPHSSGTESKEIFLRLREDHVTLETAANNLVFRGVATALDLCAAAIQHRLFEPLPGGREADVAWWFHKPEAAGRCNVSEAGAKKRIESITDSRYSGWLKSIVAALEWRLLKEARDHLTHRTVARHVVSGPRATKALGNPESMPYRTAHSKMKIGGESYELTDLHISTVRFGLARWQEFCGLLQT